MALLGLVGSGCDAGTPEPPAAEALPVTEAFPAAAAEPEVAPAAASAEAPRLVVLYSVCTVNRSFLSPYNRAVTYTPHLERFAGESAVLTSHRSESGVSGTAYASIYSGTQADRHGVFMHPRELSQDLYLIFEAFRDAGFDTFYWSAHGMAKAQLAYSQGVASEHVYKARLVGNDARFTAILRRLQEDPSYRALVVTSFSVTHYPGDTKDVPAFREQYPEESGELTQEEVDASHALFKRNAFELQSRFSEAAAELKLSEDDIAQLAEANELVYKSKINRLDSMFGSVLSNIEKQGLSQDAVVAFTADHGQQLYHEDQLFQWTHGPNLAPASVDVPLIIRGHEGRVPARRIDAVTRSIDVYPSLAGLAGIELPEDAGVQGVDLARGLQGEEELPNLRAYSHGTLRRWKYFTPDLIENIWATLRVDDLLYTWKHLDERWSFDAQRVRSDGGLEDLDPDEHRESGADLWRYRKHMIDAFYRTNPKSAPTKEEELQRLNQEEADALRALGYIE